VFRMTYFVYIFLISTLATFGIIWILKRNATPLRRAWIVYSAMYGLHSILFFGIMLTLPSMMPSFSSARSETDGIETIADVKRNLKEQREDIEQLRNQVDQIRETVWFTAFLLTLFAPMLYYNLFKYNLEIEKLSGKRMGSFD
jgi:glucan phosphoethanolaminetransferase (alkaline phosphatase superfamily)